VAAETLSARALNRATLARQLLLERAALTPLQALERLVGLQAQVPLNPYTALWSRIEGFRPEALAALLEERAAVRTVVMRATVHLVSAADCLALRPLMQPVLDAELRRHPEHAPGLRGVDLEPVLEAAREELAARPRTLPELRAALAARFPGRDAAALAAACRGRLCLVQVPPRGVWGRGGRVTVTTAESWLGRPLDRAPSIDEAVLRYLAAFGPATPADASAWSRLAGMGEVLERLRPRLRTFRDERGRELFDLPDAPRPDAATPAPPRFLPEYDNALLSHADRERVISAEDRARLSAAGGVGWGSVLVDGAARAIWRLARDRGSGAATMTVVHAGLPARAARPVAAEGRRLLRLLAADADEREVRLVAAP
jgi:hypothetical protein